MGFRTRTTDLLEAGRSTSLLALRIPISLNGFPVQIPPPLLSLESRHSRVECRRLPSLFEAYSIQKLETFESSALFCVVGRKQIQWLRHSYLRRRPAHRRHAAPAAPVIWSPRLPHLLRIIGHSFFFSSGNLNARFSRQRST